MTDYTDGRSDFERYWSDVDRRLDATPAAPEVDPLPMRSNEGSDVFTVRLTSIGPYRIFGYFTVPKYGDGPFPGLLLMPGYGSVNQVPEHIDRMRYVTLQIMHRGQRLADQPYSAAYPGLLTERIDDPYSYIFRDIAADCLRGAEFLASRPEVAGQPLAIVGNDLALITAARRRSFSIVHVGNMLFYRLLDASTKTDSYPIEEINDYLRNHPQHENLVQRSLSFLDPSYHVAQITATTIVDVDASDPMLSREWLNRLLSNFNAPVETYQLTREGATDYDAIDARIAKRLGSEPMTRFLERPIR